MNLTSIKTRLEEQSIHFSNDRLHDCDTIIGFEKKAPWRWLGIKLNTFIIISDYGDKELTVEDLENHLDASTAYAQLHSEVWHKGLDLSAVIVILLSSKISKEAIEFCLKRKSRKKRPGFIVPAMINTKISKPYYFKMRPLFARRYYDHLENLIESLK